MMKKLLKTKGFSLAEVLVATAILAIFVSATIVGTSALFGTGEEMMTIAKASVLGSDVIKAITNELRFGENFSMGDASTVKYNSTTYGDDCEIHVDGNGMLTIVQTTTAVDIFGHQTSDSKTFYPIGSAAYGEVYIKSIVFDVQNSTQNKHRQIITCTLAITSDGDNVLWEKTISVVPLYQKATA